jgi:hypothetical protein
MLGLLIGVVPGHAFNGQGLSMYEDLYSQNGGNILGLPVLAYVKLL